MFVTRIKLGPSLISVLLAVVSCQAVFYLPGVAPRDFLDGNKIDVKVNRLDSTRTQIPYDYYSLPFCQPEPIEESSENLGEILSGDKIENSLYLVNMKETANCRILCNRTYSDSQLKQFSDSISDEYRVNWIIDNMPAVTRFYTEDVDAAGTRSFTPRYEKGFPLGFVAPAESSTLVPGAKYLYNHIRLVVLYHEEPEKYAGARIVGFRVEPMSIQHNPDGPIDNPETKLKTCPTTGKIPRDVVPQPVSDLKAEQEKTVFWTYDVQWEKSDTKWASRWDIYLEMSDAEVHWTAIAEAALVVLLLSGVVAVILSRTLSHDLHRYNEAADVEEAHAEESGWKLVIGDVFRAPERPQLLAVLAGTGAQVTAMCLTTLLIASLGFLSPANRGALVQALLLLFVAMGCIAGLVSTRLIKMWGLQEWKRNALITALFFPGVVFGIFFVINIVLAIAGSTAAVSFFTLTSLLLLWLGVSLPLVYLGSFVGWKLPVIENPVKVNSIRRLVQPPAKWYMHPAFMVLLGGSLPFGAVFIEAYFIMTSVWLNQFYYVFGILFLVFVILVVVSSEISIVLSYFQLCSEDYHWWWRSFLISGSSALYLFLYSILYFFTQLNISNPTSTMIYFAYMGLASFAFFVMTGCIGYFATFVFVRKIYGSLKLD